MKTSEIQKCKLPFSYTLTSSLNRSLVLSAFCLIFYLGCSPISENYLSGDSAHYLERSVVKEQLSKKNKVPKKAKANYFFMLGELAYKEGNYKNSLKYYERAAKIEQRPAKYLRSKLVNLYLSNGELENATNQLELIPFDSLEFPLKQLKGEIYAMQDSYTEAETVFHSIVSESGSHTEISHIMLASIYVQQDKLDSAIEVLGQLTNNNPSSVLGQYYSGLARLLKGDKESAVSHYLQALKQNDTAHFIKLEAAQLLAEIGKTEKASKLTEEILQQQPKNRDALLLFAALSSQATSANNNHKTVQTSSISPSTETAHIDEGTVVNDKNLFNEKPNQFEPARILLQTAALKLEQRDFAGAKNSIYLVLNKYPTHSRARYYLASVHAGLQELDLAVKQLRLIKKNQELYRDSVTFATYILQTQKKYSEAIDILKPLIKHLGGKDVMLLNLLYSLQREAEQNEDAINTIKKLTKLKPSNDRYLFTLGVLYDQVGKKKLSIEALESAVEANPNNVNALNYLSYAYTESGIKLDRAKKLIEKVIKVEPRNGYFIDSLGWVYYKMGAYDKALKHIQEAALLVPNDAVILEHLAIIHQELGNKREARILYEKSLANAPESDDKEVAKRVKEALSNL